MQSVPSIGWLLSRKEAVMLQFRQQMQVAIVAATLVLAALEKYVLNRQPMREPTSQDARNRHTCADGEMEVAAEMVCVHFFLVMMSSKSFFANYPALSHVARLICPNQTGTMT